MQHLIKKQNNEIKKIEDLRVSGRIILYASLLLRMKSEILLNEMYKDKVDVFIEDYLQDGDVGTKVVVTLKKD